MIDGLWIGSAQSDPEPALQRVEAALQLIERFAPLHYRRVKNNLSRIWVQLVPSGRSRYRFGRSISISLKSAIGPTLPRFGGATRRLPGVNRRALAHPAGERP
jgi:hypothetical protein